ncbi:hypothetical protein, partial [Staphylococcus aureus]|uniref:hypothetical protein n=1 Tax=Staphylococcus aureus TaxID=1280 RepID=UPI0013308837
FTQLRPVERQSFAKLDGSYSELAIQRVSLQARIVGRRVMQRALLCLTQIGLLHFFYMPLDVFWYTLARRMGL